MGLGFRNKAPHLFTSIYFYLGLLILSSEYFEDTLFLISKILEYLRNLTWRIFFPFSLFPCNFNN